MTQGYFYNLCLWWNMIVYCFTFLPNSAFNTITLVAWNSRGWRINAREIGKCYKPGFRFVFCFVLFWWEPVVKHLPAQPWQHWWWCSCQFCIFVIFIFGVVFAIGFLSTTNLEWADIFMNVSNQKFKMMSLITLFSQVVDFNKTSLKFKNRTI